MPVPVKTISNTVPPGCETIGQYEIEYEAFGPDPDGMLAGGNRVTARRIVEIGKKLFAIYFIVHFPNFFLGLLISFWIEF